VPSKSRLIYNLYSSYWQFLDILFPPRCGGCGQKGSHWCPDCQRNVNLIALPVCESCGQKINQPGRCTRCVHVPPAFTALRSWGVFEGPVRNAIINLKYHRDIGLGEALAVPLAQMLRELAWEVEIVLPVPLGVARLRQRGYNQAGAVAYPLALAAGLSYRPNALRRTRETTSQVGLSYEDRLVNVSGAFRADPGTVSQRNALVVDDVATSSATINACAMALLKAGAKQVYGLTVARAIYQQP
jgi:ComF family protein